MHCCGNTFSIVSRGGAVLWHAARSPTDTGMEIEIQIQRQSAASAYRRHDSGFSSLDKNDSLADFRDSVQEKEIGEKDVIKPSASEAHTLQNELPVDLQCSTAIAMGISSDSSVEECDGGETLETGAIREYYSDLCNAVSQELDQLSTELYSRKFIERTKLDQILEVSGTPVYSKAVRVLNAASTKIASVPSMFHDFLQALEKCGICKITEQIRAYFDKQSRAYMEHKQWQSPIGGSDDELTAHRPSSAGPGENSTSRLMHKKDYQRGTSHPNPKITIKSSGKDVQDSVVQRQVTQLNIEVLQLNKQNRMLRKRIQEKDNIIKELDATIKEQVATIEEQDTTIQSLQNENQDLVASNMNLERQKSLLLSHSRSLHSLNGEEDIDHPHALLNPRTSTRHTLRVGIPLSGRGWAGCRACRRKGNTRCKESTV